MSEQTRAGYDAFAQLYDTHWCAPAAERFFLQLRPLLPSPPATVLDLCCGTGRLAERLLQEGYQVWGVDLSPQMIDLARQHAPSGTFTAADARRFSLSMRFDAITCTFDSLNHILTDDGLAEVFSCVQRHMAPAAIFAFDINTLRKYERAWEGNFEIPGELSVSATYDRQTQRAQFVGRLASGQQLHLTQRPLSRETIEMALGAAGLEISAIDALSLDDQNTSLRDRYVVRHANPAR